MIGDLCVYLDGGDLDDGRLAAAGQLATKFDAFVLGLYVNPSPNLYAYGELAMAADFLDQIRRNSRERGDQDVKMLATKLERLDAKSELRRRDVWDDALELTVTREARAFDLFVTTRPYGFDNPAAHVSEAVLFGSGRPSFFVPPSMTSTMALDRILIAWRNTRESARAVAEAMPFLSAADNVTLAMVGDDDQSMAERAAEGSDIARHLDRHHVPVEVRPVPTGHGVAHTMLEEAQLSGAGLIVMGGYGHSRYREWILGGVTRDVLSLATIPVLTAH
jgi:nucleotide-binding universal stress UspA family protein